MADYGAAACREQGWEHVDVVQRTAAIHESLTRVEVLPASSIVAFGRCHDHVLTSAPEEHFSRSGATAWVIRTDPESCSAERAYLAGRRFPSSIPRAASQLMCCCGLDRDMSPSGF